MLIDLDDERAADPGRAGAKAAWLARGRRAGLPVLPGFVVESSASREAMSMGADAFEERGSGGARLVVIRHRMDDELESAIVEAAAALSDAVVVRSSSPLEAGGEWSGAFTSYLDIKPEEAPTAVRGCWASAFGVHTLERFEAAGVEVGSVPMAVVVQPALLPDFGGTAQLGIDDTVTVVGVVGSPAPLVQGWERGWIGRVAADDEIDGDGGLDADLVRSVASLLRRARASTGANSCEWAMMGGELTLLQLGLFHTAKIEPIEVDPEFGRSDVVTLARLVRRFPGPMGEALVLPWAVADPAAFFDPAEPAALAADVALAEAEALVDGLVESVWGAGGARRAANELRRLRGGDPAGAAELFGRLERPDFDRAHRVLRLLATVRHGLAEAGLVSRPEQGWHVPVDRARSVLAGHEAAALQVRFGFDRWEPFDASVVIAAGSSTDGSGAAPGVAAGRMWFVADASHVGGFRARDVVVGTHPIPDLAPLLWDASAVVTLAGGPGAHLFESARALAIPAVCGVRLEEIVGVDPRQVSGRFTLALDGSVGRVWAHPW